MMHRIILCVFPDRLTASVWVLGRLRHCERFPGDLAGRARFAHFLHAHAGVPVDLVTDLTEEDYHVEVLPHTRGLTRRALIRRKTEQLYRNTPYRAACAVGRMPDGRRDDVILWVVLNTDESLMPWLEILRAQHAPLASMVPLSLLSGALLRRLALDIPQVLLLEFRCSGLRQSWFERGRLRGSRLVPGVRAQDSGRCAAETGQTRRYLESMRPALDEQMAVLVLAPDDESDAIAHALASTDPPMECLSFDPEQLGTRLRLDRALLREFPELLYMQLLWRHGAPVNLAPAECMQDFRLGRVRRGSIAAIAAVLAAGVVFSVVQTVARAEHLARADAVRAEAQRWEQFQPRAMEPSAAPWHGSALQSVVASVQAIRVQRQTPRRMLHVAGLALHGAPGITLRRLHWKHGPSDNGSGPWVEAGWLEGEIAFVAGRELTAQELIAPIVARLRRDPGVAQVRILPAPAAPPVRSGWQGSTRTPLPASREPAARFLLHVVLKPAEPQP